MPKQAYDLLVIGAGAAGSTAASNAAQNGARIALVERDSIGGTCLNYGCDPTKTLIYIAGMLYHARHADQFGLHISEASFEWASVISWVHQAINRIRGGTSEEAARELSHKGIDVLKGEAAFISPHELSVEGKSVYAQRLIIATGSENIIPSIPGTQRGWLHYQCTGGLSAQVTETSSDCRRWCYRYRVCATLPSFRGRGHSTGA